MRIGFPFFSIGIYLTKGIAKWHNRTHTITIAIMRRLPCYGTCTDFCKEEMECTGWGWKWWRFIPVGRRIK